MTSNPNSSDFNYKEHSLDKLKEWIHDALSCGEASPHEIYSVIREAAQEDYQYYKDHSARAFGLLELLSGHRPVAEKDDGMRPWGHSDLEYQYTATGEKFPLSCDKDDQSPECQGAWNDFWEENYYPEEYSKVKKWVLPVEQFAGSEEYLISFPDDLLEAANLKEGDLVEWVDQGDGSYLLKKVEKPMSYDEAVAAGWTMTSDGIWWPPQDR